MRVVSTVSVERQVSKDSIEHRLVFQIVQMVPYRLRLYPRVNKTS